MLILTMMMLIGLFAGVWGFMMCFLPARWNKLTEAMSFSDHWTEPKPNRSHRLIRFGNRIAGIVIFAVGCWFAYVAVSKIYLVLSGQAMPHSVPTANGAISSSPTPVLTVFSVLMIFVGAIMASIPAKVVTIFEHVWPTGRSVKPSAFPKASLFVRIFGVVLVLLAIMPLIH